MTIEIEREIVGYYSSGDRYTRNDKYSESYQTVYVKENKNDGCVWLVLDQKDSETIEVRQTDAGGKIKAWDTYKAVSYMENSKVKISLCCVEMIRVGADGSQVSFKGNDLSLLNEFSRLKAKITRLGEDVFSELLNVSTNNRKQMTDGIGKTAGNEVMNADGEETYCIPRRR